MPAEPIAVGAQSFHLEIDGISQASFSRCEGLGRRREVVSYREGGAAGARFFRGEELESSLILERGVTRDRRLWDWYSTGDRRNGAVVLLGPNGQEILRWRFLRAWPAAWEGPRLDAGRNAVALERLEIIHEGLSWVER